VRGDQVVEDQSTADPWHRARLGDPEAFTAIYDTHHDAVYNYAYRRSGSWERAEDVVSVVFLELWRGRDKVIHEADSVLPWLLGIANNVLRHQWRSAFRYHRLLARLPRAEPEDDHAERVAHRVDASRQIRRVESALSRLTEREREAFSLCVIGGVTYADAASVLGVPVGTVRSRIARARERLRTTLGADHETALAMSRSDDV
jgi:RNA polymerase sigma-70 factor (ECF subfamily)